MVAKFASWGKQWVEVSMGYKCAVDWIVNVRDDMKILIYYRLWHKHGKTLLLEKEYTGGGGGASLTLSLPVPHIFGFSFFISTLSTTY